MGFVSDLSKIIKKNNSLLCIGLDTDPDKLPTQFKKNSEEIFHFNKSIIDCTHDLVCSYKPNLAYYEALGGTGVMALKKTVRYVKSSYPAIPVIADAKRGDIASTSDKYAASIFDQYGFDGVTVSPYLGRDGIEPFLKREEKGIIILCRTSNPGAEDFQDLEVKGKALYEIVAEKVAMWNAQYNNCLLVVGATWPEQMERIRAVAKDLFFLVPGIGSQGGDLEKTLQAGLRPDRSGLIITASRSIIYAGSGKDFAEKAREEALRLRDMINEYR
jgi:orotidine-5'-phosphate decarboxylase